MRETKAAKELAIIRSRTQLVRVFCADADKIRAFAKENKDLWPYRPTTALAVHEIARRAKV